MGFWREERGERWWSKSSLQDRLCLSVMLEHLIFNYSRITKKDEENPLLEYQWEKIRDLHRVVRCVPWVSF